MCVFVFMCMWRLRVRDSEGEKEGGLRQRRGKPHDKTKSTPKHTTGQCTINIAQRRSKKTRSEDQTANQTTNNKNKGHATP